MSPLPADSFEPDFAEQLEILSAEAEQRVDSPDAKPVQAPREPAQTASLQDSLKPLVTWVEALSRATTQNTLALGRIEQTAAAQASVAETMGALQETLTQRNGTNQKLFDALHEELRSYKDGFLLEVFHKPIVRDLITLYDDLSELERQNSAFIAYQTTRNDLTQNDIPVIDQLRNMAVNLSHGIHSLVETMARMDVSRALPMPGQLDRKLQRAVGIEEAARPEEDGLIVRSLKPGFNWRGRVVRPEEVIVKKWHGSPNGDSQK